MNNRRNLLIMIIAFSLILVIGSSYAYLTYTKESTNNYVINVGTLEVTFVDSETQFLNLTDMYPMTDEEGEDLTKELIFQVKNTGNVDSYYNISLEEVSTSPEFKNYIRFIIKKNDYDYTEPKTLGANKYIDANAFLEPNKTATYKVKVWLNQDADNTYMNKEFKAKVMVNAIQNTNEYDLYDLSGNNYNAEFMNGAKIITDENSRKAISFDGVDDYVALPDLLATIDFAGGFTIEFKAKWNALNNWSRIFDFGNGMERDNIFVSTWSSGTPSLAVSIFVDKIEKKAEVPNVITIGEIQNFKIIYDKKETGYELRIYKNNELVYNTNYEIENLISNTLRTKNYLGKSNWKNDEYFNGLIYSLKITDSKGTPIIWYDLNW